MTDPQLTPYQMDIVAWAAGGATLAQIADQLGKSRSAIASQIRYLRAKLGARNLTHAVSLCWELGLLIKPDQDRQP